VQRPWISINFAISADGKIAPSGGGPSGWTSAADHRRLLELRQNKDALMVGRRTLEADRMTLTVPDAARQPLRCVVSRSGRFDPSHPLFHCPGGEIHLLAEAEMAIELPGVVIHRGNLGDFLRSLHDDFQVRSLHCEGGGMLVRSLAESGWLDEIHLTLAGHTIFGGVDAPCLTGTARGFLPSSLEFELRHFEPVPEAGECFLTYRRRHSAGPHSSRPG
jgi:2,5-diamino-6-(ribosylamino)-4(3H)-pyrimidinone 5'-phosphate reductase